MTKRKIVGLLAREHGLFALKALVDSDSFEIDLVFTHRYEPKSKGGQERSEFKQYLDYCSANGIELVEVNSKKEAKDIINKLNPLDNLDILLSVSWRYLVGVDILALFPFGGINLHRGLLPNYPGAEPILQALKNGDDKVYITAHKMIEEIDQGELIKTYEHSINHLDFEKIDDKVECIKKELGPQFGVLSLEALALRMEK